MLFSVRIKTKQKVSLHEKQGSNHQQKTACVFFFFFPFFTNTIKFTARVYGLSFRCNQHAIVGDNYFVLFLQIVSEYNHITSYPAFFKLITKKSIIHKTIFYSLFFCFLTDILHKFFNFFF